MNTPITIQKIKNRLICPENEEIWKLHYKVYNNWEMERHREMVISTTLKFKQKFQDSMLRRENPINVSHLFSKSMNINIQNQQVNSFILTNLTQIPNMYIF
jgi:hypothetical protein